MTQTRRIAGIDVGGTFTDLLLTETDASGTRVKLAKVPTTAANQALGVLAAIEAAGVSPAELDLIIHGTTVTTNAVLERKVAKVGLITTQGFRDTLELGRRTRPQPYGMFGQFEPLIPRELRIEVPERINARGEVVTPLDEEAVAEAARELLAKGCEAVVIHFLHSYANNAHEWQACKIVKAIWPNEYITVGFMLLSEFREYERGTTASVNAAVQPILDRYIHRLQGDLEAKGFARDLLVMNGNGGTIPAKHVALQAAKTVMSGPASGVMAAVKTMEQSGVKSAITYDMGGTSTDVALIRDCVPEVSAELSIAYGLPIHLPMVDVRTIGAGGGSIASIDTGGMLKVGPESAGSEPGPICFGRGGARPTITDANLILGRLDPKRLLAVSGRVALDDIRAVFARDLAEPLGMSVEQAAEAVIRLGNVHMSGAIRIVSLSRGYDPRDFVLFAFGGAGPLHAIALARELGIPEVLVPARPGLTNALGCLVADLRHDMVKTLNVDLNDLDPGTVWSIFKEHEAEGMAAILPEKAEVEAWDAIYSADMQFRGQTHLIRVPFPTDTELTRENIQALFEAAYFTRFQVHLPEIRAVLVNLNTSIIGRRRTLPLASLMDRAKQVARTADAILSERRIYADGTWHMANIYDRERLAPAMTIIGPAVIQQLDATTVIEPGATATVDAIGNLRIRVTP
jgi:N-methylhydantoinase A